MAMGPTKEEKINVRVQGDLLESLREAAEKSGWGLSEQIRFELMERRGMWRMPYLPTKPTETRPTTDRLVAAR